MWVSSTETLKNLADAESHGKRGRKCQPLFKADGEERGQLSKSQGTAHEHLALMPEQLNIGLEPVKNKLNSAYSKIRSLHETLKKHSLTMEK